MSPRLSLRACPSQVGVLSMQLSRCRWFISPSVHFCVQQDQLFPLEKVKSMVDLGVRFDNNLTFGNHISEKN